MIPTAWPAGPILETRGGRTGECVDIHEQAKRAEMDGEPIALGVFQTFGDIVKASRLIGFHDTFVASLNAGGHAVIGDIGHGLAGFQRHQLGNLCLAVTDQVGGFADFRGPVPGAGLAPDLESRLRGVQGCVDIRLGGGRDGSQHVLRGRVGNGLGRLVRGGCPLSSNEEIDILIHACLP